MRFSFALSLMLVSSVALAQLPWGDQAPRVDGEHVRSTALGQPDHRVDDWGARRLSARRRGERRARSSLHRWADDALARVGAPPHVAQAVHRVIDEASARMVRPLADGSAVVVLMVERAALRRAAPLEGVPW